MDNTFYQKLLVTGNSIMFLKFILKADYKSDRTTRTIERY